MKSRAADPFRESAARTILRKLRVLGAEFRFEADDRRLLGLVDAAFARLPPLTLARPAGRLDVEVRLQPGGAARREPPMAQYSSGAGLLCATVDAANFAIVDPAGRRAFVAISEAMLGSVYHARYELLEFAAMTLAARTQGLMPLHGACVVRNGRGVLLLGASGVGKSTLCLHSLLEGFELVSEDSVFVEPATLRAVGLANFLHLRPEALRLLRTRALASSMNASPTIRRRSGVRKREFDVRDSPLRAARRAPRIVAAVFVTARRGRRGAEVAQLDARELAARLERDQPYAAQRKGWRSFVAAIRGRAWELRRGAHPRDSVRLLQDLLDGRA
jgi:hypothetical protein